MKMRFEFPGDGPSVSPQRGATPVGFLHELPPIELAAIVYLRAWCEGGAERQMITSDFRLVMGEVASVSFVQMFDALLNTFLNNARRPVMRHGLRCKCFGGDESAFANMVAAACAQDRDDALLFASTLMTGQAAWTAVELAIDLGQVFLRLARVPDRMQGPTHGNAQTNYRH